MATNRNRVIYSAAALFASQGTSCTGAHFSSGNSGVNLIKQVPRVQDVSFNFDIPRQSVQQMGQLAELDRIIVDSPTVGLNFSWLETDGSSENALGFNTNGMSTFISGILSAQSDDKNYFIQLSSEGVDAVTDANNNTKNVIAIGNGYLSNYSLDLSVGQLPKASLSVEGLNIKFDTGNNGNNFIPAVNPIDGQKITGWKYTLPTAVAYTGANIVSALRPGDLQLNLAPNAALGNVLSGAGSVHIQSMNIAVPLSRETVNRLGTKFAYARNLALPIQTTMSISALQADLRESNLADIFCNDASYNFSVIAKVPDCVGTGASSIVYQYKGAKLQSQDQSQLAGISLNTDIGFFYSGSYSGS
jgi:hypothetical protein